MTYKKLEEILEPHQLVNFKTLLDYLRKGKLKAKFNLEMYSDGLKEIETDCGSEGCAIGHGPYAGIEKLSTEAWFEYHSRTLTNSNNELWAWCFGMDNGFMNEELSELDNVVIKMHIALNEGVPAIFEGKKRGEITQLINSLKTKFLNLQSIDLE